MEEFKPKVENKENLSKKVLLADDNLVVLQGIQIMLEMEGYEVVAVTSKEELIQTLETGQKFDIVITDKDMPEENAGIEAIKYIRKKLNLNDMPIVLQSGSLDIENIAKAVEELRAEYISKPFSTDALLEKMKMAAEKIHD